jgi:hypothetical protein
MPCALVRCELCGSCAGCAMLVRCLCGAVRKLCGGSLRTSPVRCVQPETRRIRTLPRGILPTQLLVSAYPDKGSLSPQLIL